MDYGGYGYGDDYAYGDGLGFDDALGMDGLDLNGGGFGGDLGYDGIGGGFGGGYGGFMDDFARSREIPLIDAWGHYGAGDNAWADEQYQLGDLMYYQQQLQLDRALSEEERLARWEERLRWEELDDTERRMRYAQMAELDRRRLGVAGGWYGRRFGGRNDDLGYLRNVRLQRGLFAGPYRGIFSRHRGLHNRFASYYSRQHIHGFGGAPRLGLGRGLGGGLGCGGLRGGGLGGVPLGGGGGYGLGGRGGFGLRLGGGYGLGGGGPIHYPIRLAYGARFGSRPLAAPGLNLRDNELRTRLRIAETRAALTGITAEARARALDDARRIKAEINGELRQRQVIDRVERRQDAVLAAQDQIQREVEMEREIDAERRNYQIQRIAAQAPVGSPGIGWGYGGVI